MQRKKSNAYQACGGCGGRNYKAYGGGTSELKIAHKTYDYYIAKLGELPENMYQSVKDDLESALSNIKSKNIAEAVRNLTNVFEISSENNFISSRITYPGPGKFKTLQHYLE